MFRRASGYFSPGLDADEYIVRNGGDRARIVRLPHIIDQSIFRLSLPCSSATSKVGSTSLKPRSLRLTYVGRLIPGKGLDHLLMAFSQTTHATLDLIGSGPLDDSLHALAESTGCSERVQWHGFLQPLDVAKILQVSDCLILPSLADTYGLVIDEALACGCYVISTDAVGEVSSRIAGSSIGAIVDNGSVQSLTIALNRLERDGVPGTREERNSVVAPNTVGSWADTVVRTVGMSR